MKSKITLTIVLLALYCACAAAQQTPAAAASAPYAGATISDFKGKVSIQLPAQAFAAPVRGEVLPPDTTVNTDEGRLLLNLSDGSDVLVRPHTKLLFKRAGRAFRKFFRAHQYAAQAGEVLSGNTARVGLQERRRGNHESDAILPC